MDVTTSTRRFLLAMAGNTGAHLMSVVILVPMLLFSETSLRLGLEVIAAAAVCRLLVGFTHSPKPVLTTRPVRKYLAQTLSAETKFSLALLGVAYFTSWPIAKSSLALFVGGNLVAQLLLFGAGRVIIRKLSWESGKDCQEHARNRVLIVGTGPKAQAVSDLILRSPELETAVDGFLDYRRTGFWRYRDIPLIGHPTMLEGIAARSQVDAVVLAVEPDEMQYTAPLLAAAERMGVTVSLMPDMYRPNIARAVQASLNGTPTVSYRRVPESRLALLLKSGIDKVGAAVGLLIASPIMFIAAIAIKIDSPGPIFYKQVRSGINGRRFGLYKFRTMCADADKRKDQLKDRNEMSGPVFKIKDDPRITRVGKILRRYSIDEIPQFFNVIKGDMSLVGPRPPLPSEVVEFEPWQRRKLSVRPGLTCIWQINGRNQVDFEDWMRMDLDYIDNWSLWLDTKILVRTVPTVLKGEGAV